MHARVRPCARIQAGARAPGAAPRSRSRTHARTRAHASLQEANAHMEQLRPAVKKLASLEVEAQLSFISLKRKWATAGGDA